MDAYGRVDFCVANRERRGGRGFEDEKFEDDRSFGSRVLILRIDITKIIYTIESTMIEKYLLLKCCRVERRVVPIYNRKVGLEQDRESEFVN